MADDKTLSHYGTKRHSGRYPWNSGGNENRKDLLGAVERLSNRGLSEKEIAQALEMSISELRSQKSLETGRIKEEQRLNVTQQKERGMSVEAISREFDIPPSTVRDLLKPAANAKYRAVKKIADTLQHLIGKGQYLDVGQGSEIYLNTSRTKLDNAVQLLENQGYTIHKVYQEQLGTDGRKTTIKVLAGPDVPYSEVLQNRSNIQIPNFVVKDSGEASLLPPTPQNISSKRVLVKYANDGGGDKDGLIELRRGVPEFDLGGRGYAQVRMGVDGTHFLKGMAVLRDDLPKGVDVVYNTSKDPTGNPLDAMKEQKEKAVGNVSVFGAIVRPNTYLDKNGKEVFGPINIVGDASPSEEGTWANWNSSLASQVLSKQSPRLASKQLQIVSDNYKAELDDIRALTNPVVKNHLLIEYADKADRAAVDLKAAALPRQTTNVLLPDPKLKVNEVYAPNYNNGEELALVRYPHGGVFEIPTLKVNNKYSQYRDIIGTSPKDAIAIHPEVAQKLSGADFDGDFVLAIPNKKGEIRTSPSLEGLKGFDPVKAYPKYDGMKVLSEKQKQRLMGDVSNLITDMTIKGASQTEIAAAVRHSMVVIDAAKHELNYKKSYEDNRIAALKQTYQGSARKGASTLISRSKSQERVPLRREHYEIDPTTGKKVYTHTDEVYTDKKGNIRTKQMRSTKMGEADTPEKVFKLSSGTPIEKVYANHAIKMKDLANQARLASLDSKSVPYSRQARITYQKEVDSLNAKYKEAVRARPLERKAQLVGNEIYKAKVESTPDMSYADKQKARGQSIQSARSRLKSSKQVIEITPREWEAIEMGAISTTRLKGILRNADMDVVRSYATPRAVRTALSTGKASRAKALLKGGYTNAEVANVLGVPVSQIRDLEKD